jgi:hypothetical protein
MSNPPAASPDPPASTSDIVHATNLSTCGFHTKQDALLAHCGQLTVLLLSLLAGEHTKLILWGVPLQVSWLCWC